MLNRMLGPVVWVLRHITGHSYGANGSRGGAGGAVSVGGGSIGVCGCAISSCLGSEVGFLPFAFFAPLALESSSPSGIGCY